LSNTLYRGGGVWCGGGGDSSYSDRFLCSYILFIIIIGGILVLLIYITRLASNEIFSPSKKLHREVCRAKDLSAPQYIPSLFCAYSSGPHSGGYDRPFRILNKVILVIRSGDYMLHTKLPHKFMCHSFSKFRSVAQIYLNVSS
jgi:hypothetical protein